MIDSTASGMLLSRLHPPTFAVAVALISSYFVLGPRVASAHHLELSRFELRAVSGGVVTGRFLLAPKDVPPAAAASDEALLAHVRAHVTLRWGQQNCTPDLSIVERYREGSPAPGHLVDLACRFAAPEAGGSLVVRRAEPLGALLVTYPRPGHTEEQALLLPSNTDAPVPLTVAPARAAGAIDETPTPTRVGSPAASVATGDPFTKPPGSSFWSWLTLGFEHVLPAGLDHVLFVLGLGLVAVRNMKQLTVMLVGFTVAHAVALYLAATEVVALPPSVVEPAIAATIVLVALQGAFVREPRNAEWRLMPSVMSSLAFGLIHGAGFGRAFLSLGVPRSELFSSLVWFHLGVELGQSCVLLASAALLLFVRRVGASTLERVGEERLLRSLAGVIAVSGAFWFFQRI